MPPIVPKNQNLEEPEAVTQIPSTFNNEDSSRLASLMSIVSKMADTQKEEQERFSALYTIVDDLRDQVKVLTSQKSSE